MKNNLLLTLLLTYLIFLSSCSKDNSIVPVKQSYSKIEYRGKIDQNLVKSAPEFIVSYGMDNIAYVTVIYPHIYCYDAVDNYIWHIQWSMLCDKRHHTIFDKNKIFVKWKGFCSVSVEVWCENIFTGVKSQEISNIIFIKK